MRTQIYQADGRTAWQRDHEDVLHCGGGDFDLIARRDGVPEMQVDFAANESRLDDDSRQQVRELALTVARWVHDGLSSGEVVTGPSGRAGFRILVSGGNTSSEDGNLGRARAQAVSRDLHRVLEEQADSVEPWLRAVARSVQTREVLVTVLSHGQGTRMDGTTAAGTRAVLVAVGDGRVASFPSQLVRELLMRVCVVMAARANRMVLVSPEAVEHARVQLGISGSVAVPGALLGTDGPTGVQAAVAAIGGWLVEQREREKAQPWLISGIDFLRGRAEMDAWQASRVDLLAELLAQQISALGTGPRTPHDGGEPDGQRAQAVRICVVGGNEPSEPTSLGLKRAWAVVAQLRRHPGLAFDVEQAGVRFAVMSRGRGSRLAGTTNEARRQVLVQVDDGRPTLMEFGSWDLLLRVRAQMQIRAGGQNAFQLMDPDALALKLNEFEANQRQVDRSESGTGQPVARPGRGLGSRGRKAKSGSNAAGGSRGVESAAECIAEWLVVQ